MCSIGEDDFGDEGGLHAMVPNAESVPDCEQGVCKKCGQIGAVYKLSFRAQECRNCFLSYVRHKFRATLGSSKILPRDAQVLLVFDGSAESAVLLDMLHYALTQSSFKRLHCYASVLFIDDCLLVNPNQQSEVYMEHIYAVCSLLSSYNQFDAYLTSFAPLGAEDSNLTIFNIKEVDVYLKRDTGKEIEFAQQIAAISSLTSRQDYVKHYRRRLISTVASHLKCRFVFLPDISTYLATQLLSTVALGRGTSAALDVALVDDRNSAGIKLIRPLRDITALEVQLYMRAQQIQPLQVHQYGEAHGPAASLQNLTLAFMQNLQDNFASTVSTVFRTGDKIAPHRGIDKNGAALHLAEEVESYVCSFCNSPLDVANSKTQLALEFSHAASVAGTALDKCIEPELKPYERSSSNKNNCLDVLCYACRNIRRDFDASYNGLLLS